MKKFIVSLLMFVVFACGLVFASAETTYSQTYLRRVVRNGRVTYVRVRKPSYYRRHRNRINVAAGAVGGALLGGIIGGKKGMLIGAGAGAGSAALYTYVWNKKKRRYVKVRRY